MNISIVNQTELDLYVPNSNYFSSKTNSKAKLAELDNSIRDVVICASSESGT